MKDPALARPGPALVDLISDPNAVDPASGLGDHLAVVDRDRQLERAVATDEWSLPE
ncbi:MAG: hypothetical protein M3460_12530 [Actinomycetota bacterium]|nr:hypothetical protein [Actinomycetota bacterium]